jgi:hypothetical protein
MARLADEQRRHPVRGRPDRANQLAAVIEPHLPDSMRALLAEDVVKVGEIAKINPDVRTIPLDAGNFVVLFNSGMMDFVYAVCRAMSRITTFLGDPAEDDAREAGPALVAADVARLFEEWRRHTRLFSRKKPISHATFPLSPDALVLTEIMAKLAQMFILAHELGHVDLDRNDAPRLSNNEEINADALGFVSYFPAATQHSNPRLAFAGAVLTVRIFAGLERVGVKFAAHYPPQRERMALLHQMLAGLSSCPQHYHELTTISVGYESMMDHVDDLIEGRQVAGTSYPDAGRLIGFMIGALEEVAKSSLPEQTFIEDMQRRASTVPPKIVRDAAARLWGFYVSDPSPDDTFIPKHIRDDMGRALKRLVPALPEGLRGVFP